MMKLEEKDLKLEFGACFICYLMCSTLRYMWQTIELGCKRFNW